MGLIDYDGSSNLVPLKFRQDFAGGNLPVYIGETKPGKANDFKMWRIRKIIYDGSNRQVAILWADGSGDFDKSWDDRAGYNYSDT